MPRSPFFRWRRFATGKIEETMKSAATPYLDTALVLNSLNSLNWAVLQIQTIRKSTRPWLCLPGSFRSTTDMLVGAVSVESGTPRQRHLFLVVGRLERSRSRRSHRATQTGASSRRHLTAEWPRLFSEQATSCVMRRRTTGL